MFTRYQFPPFLLLSLFVSIRQTQIRKTGIRGREDTVKDKSFHKKTFNIGKKSTKILEKTFKIGKKRKKI